jgi:5S rRNA maturation endonuclease (ribonuclease M5)
MSGGTTTRKPVHIRQPRAEYYAWKMEQTERIIDELRIQSELGVPVIVEGRRDEAALRKLGVKGPIHCLKARGESRYEFLERVDGSSRAIVLVDFDREGRKLEAWLYKELSQRGIFSDLKLWSRIRSLARGDVRSVEELPSFVRALQSRSLGVRPEVLRLSRKLQTYQ